ncbi:MAG TPA: hypothetical protein PKA82_15485 [Pyrinomonadaceae bacterium]|nr:hypothetical protein [Pyrinomonadaceae bacterium]
MELLAHLLYFLANRGVLLLVFCIFFTIAAVSVVSFWRHHYLKRLIKYNEGSRVFINVAAVVCYATVFGLLALSVVNVFRPHLVDGYLINAIGNRADAVVTNIEPTSSRLNNSVVMKHSVVFKTAAGENIETYFHTWDFNVYPSANSTRYPQQGQSFRVLYLPSYPTTFLIANDDPTSEHTRSLDCGDLIKALQAAKIKHDFDPKDANFKKTLDEAAQKVIDAKCGTTTVDGNSF